MTNLQWEVGEDAWRDGGHSQPPHQGRRSLRWRWVVLAVLLLGGLAAGGVWGWLRWSEEAIQADLAAAVQQESLVMASVDRNALNAVMDAGASHDWFTSHQRRMLATPPPLPVGVEKARFFGEVAMVPVLLPGALDDAAPLRETRFYRLVDAQWRRTEPPEALWGGQKEWVTPHFRFLYGDLDAEAVEALAAEIETLYTETVAEFGLVDAPDSATYVVEVLPQSMPALTLVGKSWLQVGSPYLRPVAKGLTNRDVLARQVGGWVVSHLLYERANLSSMSSRLFTFMLYCVGETAVAGWAPRDPAWELARDRYLEQAASVAGKGPTADSIYLLFGAGAWEERHFQCSTLGEFVVERFGTERFGDLAEAASQRHSWTEAVELAFDLPYERFRQEWWAFVRERYG